MAHPGMWQPKQKDGRNWAVTFSVDRIDTNEEIRDRVKTFRVRADAYLWIERMKALTIEANQRVDATMKNFTYKVSKIKEQS